jgi:prepilin-type N-terminal cleavage/methylation domain-containing protein
MRKTRGFTLIETMAAVATGAILLGIVSRPVNATLDRIRVTRAAQVVAADLDLARSSAQRQRRPVRIVFDASAMRYAITDRATGTVLRSRELGAGSDLHLRTVTFSPTTVDVFPARMTSGALSVSVGSGGFSRQVTMSRTGMVRAP